MTEARERTRQLIVKREDVLRRLQQILVEQLHVQRPPEEIEPDVSLFGTGLGLDSVDAVEVVLCLETEFGVKMPDQAAARSRMRTVNTLIDLILQQRGERP